MFCHSIAIIQAIAIIQVIPRAPIDRVYRVVALPKWFDRKAVAAPVACKLGQKIMTKHIGNWTEYAP